MSKMAHGFDANFTVSMSGHWVVLHYKGVEVQKTHIALMGAAYSDFQVFSGQLKGETVYLDDPEGVLEKAADGGAPNITVSEIEKFIATYASLQKKYTGQSGRYPKPVVGSKESVRKNWKAFANAAAQAKQAGLLPNEYLEMIISHYTRRVTRQGSQASLPFPNQLHGDWAQSVIIEETARRHALEVPAPVRASRLAQTNSRLKLDDDPAYLESRNRITKTKNCTEFDIEYVKARLTQLYGQPKQWVLDAEKEFNERIRKAPRPTGKEDLSNG
mgnify:CR=1 FL=1